MSTNGVDRAERPQDYGHIRALDGLRGFAVLMVFTYHVFFGVFRGTSLTAVVLRKVVTSGWIGVDMFFVLSGFLITTILLDARSAENYFKVFYIRRALRIFPLYYLVVAGSLLLEPGHYSWKAQIFYWLNLSNLPTAFRPFLIGYLAHFWSLGIEEQFYLVWPSVIRRFRTRTVAYLCIGVIAGLFVVRTLPVVSRLNQHWPELVYRLTPFRVDTLCAGALLAIICKYRPRMLEHRNVLRALFLGALSAFLVTGQIYTQYWVIVFGYSALVLCFAALIALSLFPGGWTSRIFTNAFLRQLGKYSYAFYLFHPFVVNFIAAHRAFISTGFARSGTTLISPTMETICVYPLEFAVIFGLSALSWNFFEGPILRFKRHFRYSPKPDHYLA